MIITQNKTGNHDCLFPSVQIGFLRAGTAGAPSERGRSMCWGRVREWEDLIKSGVLSSQSCSWHLSSQSCSRHHSFSQCSSLSSSSPKSTSCEFKTRSTFSRKDSKLPDKARTPLNRQNKEKVWNSLYSLIISLICFLLFKLHDF